MGPAFAAPRATTSRRRSPPPPPRPPASPARVHLSSAERRRPADRPRLAGARLAAAARGGVWIETTRRTTRAHGSPGRRRPPPSSAPGQRRAPGSHVAFGGGVPGGGLELRPRRKRLRGARQRPRRGPPGRVGRRLHGAVPLDLPHQRGPRRRRSAAAPRPGAQRDGRPGARHRGDRRERSASRSRPAAWSPRRWRWASRPRSPFSSVPDPLGLAAALGISSEEFWTAAKAAVTARGAGVVAAAGWPATGSATAPVHPHRARSVTLRLVLPGSVVPRALGGPPRSSGPCARSASTRALITRIVAAPDTWELDIPLVDPGRRPAPRCDRPPPDPPPRSEGTTRTALALYPAAAGAVRPLCAPASPPACCAT